MTEENSGSITPQRFLDDFAAGDDGFLKIDSGNFQLEDVPSYTEKDEAERIFTLSGQEETPTAVQPVTEGVILETVGTQETLPEDAAKKLQETSERHQRHMELLSASGDLGLSPDAVKLMNDRSVDPKTAAFNATISVGQSLLDTEIARLQKEEDNNDDSLLEDAGEFIYETFVSGVVDPLVRQVQQQFTDDPVKDDAIVQEFLRRANEESSSQALEFLRKEISEGAGEDVLGYQRVDRLHRIADGLSNFGTTVLETSLSVFDVATLGGGPLIVKGGRAAVSRVQRVVRGSTDRQKTSENISKIADEEIDPALSTEAGAAAADSTTAIRVVNGESIGPNRVDASATAVSRATSRIESEVERILRSSQAGRVTSQETIDSVVQGMAAAVSHRLGRNILDFANVSDGFELQNGIVRTAVRIGTKSGKPFQTKLNAQSQAATLKKNKAPEGDVSFDVVEDADGYVVQATTTRRLDSSELRGNSLRERGPEGNKINSAIEGTRDFVLKYLGNSYENLDSQISRQMEGIRASLGRAVSDEYRNAFGKLSSKDKTQLGDLIRRLRDGDLSHRREALTDAEFEELWSSMYNDVPNEKMLKAYQSWRDMEFFTWKAEATKVLGSFLNQGYDIGIDVGTGKVSRYLPSRAVSKDALPQGATVYDIRFNKTYALDEIPERYAKGNVIYRVAALDEQDKAIRYVVNPEREPRALSLEDVYGFNTGGNRINPNANYFVEIGKGSLSGGTRTVGSATTEKQARVWAQELDNIIGAIRRDAPDADDIVRQNNTFNPEISSVDDFQKWADNLSINFMADGSKIGYKARDEAVEFSGVDDLVLSKMETEVIKRQRQNDVLPHYGGEATAQYDPVDYIHQQSQSAVYNITRNAIAIADVESFLYRNKDLIENWAEIKEMSPIGMAANAKIPLSTQKSRLAREQLDIMASRLHIDTPGEKKLKALSQRMGEFILDMKGGFPKAIQDTGLFENVARRFADPTNELLHLGFITKFGFFNFSQLVLQAMQVPVMLGISPKAGLKASMISTHMWASIMTNDRLASDLALKRLSKVSGVDEKVLKEIKTDLSTSGRAIINADAAELGTPVSRGFGQFAAENYSRSAIREAAKNAGSRMGRLKDASLVFFNQGEMVSRINSRIIANLEYRAKFPNKDATSVEALEWIAKRDGVLSFHMTSSGRAMAQRGLLKVPTQWLTYILRAHEAVFVGRGLTRAERLRAAVMLGPFWGAAGTPFAGQEDADALADYLGVEPGGEWHTAFRTGVIEGAIAALVGSENTPNIGLRSAPVQGVVDMWENTVGGEAPQVLGGPSGQILWDISVPLAESVNHLVNGRLLLSKDKALQTVRNIAGVDNQFKATGILMYGRYVSKTGASVPGDFSITEALTTALGFAPSQVSRYYQSQGEGYDYGKNKRAIQRYVQRTFQTAIETNDPDHVAEVLDELTDVILVSALTEADKDSVRESLLRDTTTRAIMKWLNTPRTVSDENIGFREEAIIRDLKPQEN